MLIKQIGATRTKLYIPLLTSGQGPSRFDFGGVIEQTQAAVYTSLGYASFYRRKVNNLSRLADYNAWELETLTSASGTARGSVIFNNRTQNLNILGTSGVIESAAIRLNRSPFNEGLSGFSTENENENFDVKLRCEFGCASGNISLYKAGLWVTLEFLTMADVHYRTSLGQLGVAVSAPDISERTLVDLAAFSNPTLTFRALGNVSNPGDAADLYLMSAAAADSGTAGLTTLSAALSFTSTTKTMQETGPVAVPTGTRVLPQIQIGTGQMTLTDTFIVVNTQK